MCAYAKTAPGETLSYRPPDLNRYAGEQFCLRITPEDFDLDRCFFVYLDERFEGYSLRKLFQTYFIAPGPEQEAEMASWLEPWLHMDPMLPKKRMLLRQLFAKVREHSGKVLFYINHGPGPLYPEDTVRSHLGTSVFDDGSFDDKILDVVLEFYADGEPLPELDQWARFDPIDTSVADTAGPTSGTNRRSLIGSLGLFLIAMLSLPFLLFSCRGRRGPNVGGGGGGGFGGGFGGGML
ncbi:hypothetical protein V5E97_23165 [Singulisphaera sp. Ch08]|uniref:TPM domain-containing protein n=1 Tax=Singulisphaera sp. Ch08 TaxID=3120278 RepID=A0AAU7C7J6_9BACT